MPKHIPLRNSFLIIPFLITNAASSSSNTMSAIPHIAYAPSYNVERAYAAGSRHLFNPLACYKAARLAEGAGAKNRILMPLIAAECFDFHNPDVVFALQKKSCDMLIQAYAEAKMSDETLISAHNRLAVELNYAIDQNIDLKNLPRNCLHALTIISDHALKRPNIASLYLPCEDVAEQEKFLNKVFRSAARYDVLSAALMLILTSADEAQASHDFTSFYGQHGSRAIEALCTATKHGYEPACKLALALASTKTYAEEKLALLNAAVSTGNILAHYELGRHYKEAFILNKDKSYEEIEALKACAQKHLIIAADAGLREAQLDLATMPKTFSAMIEALSVLARDPTFPLQGVAQQRLAGALCKWAAYCLEHEIPLSPYTPTASYSAAVSLFEQAIRSIKESLSSIIFSDYINAVRNLTTLTPNLSTQQKTYALALAFLKEQTVKHPVAQHAYDELAHHRTLSNREIEICVRQIQARNYFIDQIISRAQLELDSVKRMGLYTLAEDYLIKQPENAMTASLNGLVAFCKGDYEAACKHFNIVIKDNPQDILSQYLLSIALNK